MSNAFVTSVLEFNQKILCIQPREKGLLPQAELDLSVVCLKEEIQEFSDAHAQQDFIGAVDALIDLQYFAIGVMYKLGLTEDQINKSMQAVHQANMSKRRGIKAGRGDGSAADAVKPEGWVAPEEAIAKILTEE